MGAILTPSLGVSAALLVVLGVGYRASAADFFIKDGVVRYTEDGGEPKAMNVGRRCADLWVAPDSSIIAFVAIDESKVNPPFLLPGEEPLIERSSIYVARRAEHFVPVRVLSKQFEVDGRTWGVLRYPSIAPDGNKLFLMIPYAMTTFRLMSCFIESGACQDLGAVTDYCVVWGGSHSSAQILQRRHVEPERAEGIIYSCDLRTTAGTSAISESCPDFQKFASGWAQGSGGTCTMPFDSGY